jgi:hypothetical protein
VAAITAPERTAAQHQSLLHFIGQGAWSDAEVLGEVREMVLPRIGRYGPIEAWIVDDTSIPKQGRHSVGVAHQYCGQLGKQANCQVAVSLSLANHDASLPVAYRVYLPQAWAEDEAPSRPGGVPEDSPLHDQGFVSIGCAPCTRAIRAGEPERAGRWWWEQERKECGLHGRHIVLVPAPAQLKDFPREGTS